MTDPNMMDGDLSSIEGVLIDEENTRFIQHDDMDINIVDHNYEEEGYHYNQVPQPSESPHRGGYSLP